MNINRPLVPVSSDPSAPEILTPATFLTQKTSPLRPTPGNFVAQVLYAKQWRQVQYLANRFWSRWRKEFLSMLQEKTKVGNDYTRSETRRSRASS